MKQKFTGKNFKLTAFVEQEEIVRADSPEAIQRIKDFFNFNASEFQGFKPGVMSSDMIPKPEDYFLFPFRLISATVLGAGTWKATDFSNEKVLKESVPYLSNKPAYVNHDIRVGNEIGYIGQTQWTPKSRSKDGTDVPAGIDGPYVIDYKLFPDLVRKMNAPTSPIQSSSVTAIFDWEASHEFENESDFYYHLGEEVQGEMVRRIVTKIHSYIESSLVYLGADPFAKRRDSSGDLINIDKTGIVSMAKFDKDPMSSIYKDQHHLFVWDDFQKEKTLSLRERITINYSKTETEKNKTDMDIKNFIAGKLGVKPEEVTIEMLGKFEFVKAEEATATKDKLTKLDSFEKENGTFKTEIETFKKSVKDLKDEKTILEPMAKFGKEIIDGKRKKCIEVYSKSVSGKPEQIIVDEINACEDYKSLDAKMKFFGAKLMDDFAAHCEKCGSDNVSFRSSESEGAEGGKDSEKGINLASHFRM